MQLVFAAPKGKTPISLSKDGIGCRVFGFTEETRTEDWEVHSILDTSCNKDEFAHELIELFVACGFYISDYRVLNCQNFIFHTVLSSVDTACVNGKGVLEL